MTTVLSFILAAMLGPRAFGVIAMALVFTSFIEMLQEQGLMPAIISREELDEEHKDTAFWLVIAAGAALTTAGLFVAPWWARLNRLPELAPLIQVLCMGIPLSSSVIVHEALLRRSMRFKALAARTWLGAIMGGVAGLGAALLGAGVWSLVAQQLMMVVTQTIVLWRVTGWRPRVRFSLRAAHELWLYSVKAATSSLALFLGGRLDVVVGGAFFGPSVIGVYRLAQRLTDMMLDLTARGMQAVSLPALSEVQGEDELFRRRLLSMQRQVAYLALPVVAVVAALAQEVERLLGDEWHGTATAIRLLAAAQAVKALVTLMGPALQARGRPGILSVLLWIFTALGGVALAMAATIREGDRGVVAICLAVLAANVVTAVLMTHVSSRILGLTWPQLVSSWLPGVLMAAAAFATATTVRSLVAEWPTVAVAAVSGGAALIAAAALILAGDRTVRRALLASRPRRTSPAMSRHSNRSRT